MTWQNNPPTYEQWISAGSEGYWWIKFTIPSFEEDGLVFPPVHLYEAVRIFFEPNTQAGYKSCLRFKFDKGKLHREGRLTFNRSKQTHYCDDLSDPYNDVQWQAVAPHSDNVPKTEQEGD